MGKKAIKSVLVLLAVLFIFNNHSLSQPAQKDITKEADLLLDMMEYRSAILNYMKVLSKSPKQRDIRKNIAYAYFQEKKVDDALKFLKEELILFPDNGDAYDFLVYVLYKLDKIPEAYDFLESLDFPIRLTEENPHIGGLGCFILGMYFKALEKHNKAEIYFRKALEKGHDPVKCYVQLIDIEIIHRDLETFSFSFSPKLILETSRGSIFAEAVEANMSMFRPEYIFIGGLKYFENYFKEISREGLNLNKSIESFKLASKNKPNFKDALFNLACLSYNFNDFIKASEYFHKILRIEPENDEIKFYLDCCSKKLNRSLDNKPTSEQCPKWIELSRDFIDKPDREYKYKFKNDIAFVLERINYLGLEFIKNGKFHEALKRFRNGLKIDPENPGFHFNMGMVYSWLDNLEEAEKHALIALRVKDYFGSVPDYRKIEILKEEKGNIDKPTSIPLSRWTFEAALKEGSYFLDAYNSLGTIYFQKREFDKSILAFNKVIEIHPEDAMGHYNLGCAYWEINDWKNAEKEWKDAIKYEEELKRMIKRGEISEDQLDVSLIVLKRAVSLPAHKFLGRLYLERNLPDKALKEFEKAIELESGDPDPYYELGRIYHAKSELNEKYVSRAIFYYEKYLYLGGEKEKEVKGLLKSLK
jgi:tetratricopeptide (TPR) repeat protein